MRRRRLEGGRREFPSDAPPEIRCSSCGRALTWDYCPTCTAIALQQAQDQSEQASVFAEPMLGNPPPLGSLDWKPADLVPDPEVEAGGFFSEPPSTPNDRAPFPPNFWEQP